MKYNNSPAMLTVLGEIERQLGQTNDRAAAQDFGEDMKLSWLTGHVGSIATTTRREQAILRVAAVSWAWLESFGIKSYRVASLIANERVRQRRLFSQGKLLFAVHSPLPDWTRKLRVLVEELGEVAEALDVMEQRPRTRIVRDHVIEELVQVAAVSVAWLESFEVKS